MSIHYLLDGYNIIYQMPTLNLAKLEDQRCHLVHFVERYSPQGSPNNGVTIVFDGNKEAFGRMTSSAAKIIFSQNGSADDMIRNIVEQASQTKNIIVVTDDRELQYAVRALGAKTRRVKVFLSQAKSANKKKRFEQDDSSVHKKVISKCDESKINEELQKIWLKPDQEGAD